MIHRISLLTHGLRLILPVVFALSAFSARAQQVTFTIEATANQIKGGYQTGTPYEFVFTVGSFAENGASEFDETNNTWVENSPTHSQLFIGASGMGLTGTYTRPTASRLVINSGGGQPFLAAVVGQTGTTDTFGVTTPGGKGITLIVFRSEPAPFTAGLGDFPGTYTDPVIYFGDHDGADLDSSGGYLQLRYLDTPEDLGSTELLFFTVSSASLTYSAAVPEPSTYAAVAGAMALGCAWWRRQRKAGAAKDGRG